MTILCSKSGRPLFFLAVVLNASLGYTQTTALFLDSQPGEYVGRGEQRTITAAQATFAVSSSAGNAVRVVIAGATADQSWDLDFAAANDLPLTVGSYVRARRVATGLHDGLNVMGNSRSCVTLTGRFLIRELVYGAGNSVQRLAADFEQHCEDAALALFGAIRYNSTIGDLAPFGGLYPLYRLTVSPAAGGRVTGGGIDCGGGASACVNSLPQPALVSLTATPESGYVFTGWTADCAGGPATSLHVNGPKTCGATFEPSTTSPRTLLYLRSELGDSMGLGKTAVYSTANSNWGLSASPTGDRVLLALQGLDEEWLLELSAGGSHVLQPGAYAGARQFTVGVQPALDVRNSRRTCASVTGRFVVHEIGFGPGGSVTQFAADFEQHCNDTVPALFGAIRYNATFVDVQPFGGHYPSYALSVSVPLNGRIIGAGLDCGGGGSACLVTLPGAGYITLTATPNPGYIFAGWSDDCFGDPTVSVHVNGAKHCAATFEPLVASSPRTLLLLDSVWADFMGQGVSYAYAPANSRWTMTSGNGGRSATIRVEAANESWSLAFSAASRLEVGSYGTARRFPYTAFVGLNVERADRNCEALTGRYVIREIVYGSADTILRFAADFEQHCEDAVAALFGAIRYNSTIGDIAPFGGDYPVYELRSTIPTNGRVSGAGLNCGNGGSACVVPLPAAARVTLTATPNPHYFFAGWTNDCQGGATTSLHVNGPKTCTAIFEPLAAALPRTLLNLTSDPGEPIGQGRTEVHSSANSLWSVQSSDGGQALYITVVGVGEKSWAHWTLQFAAPAGETLRSGTRYANATWSGGTAPRISVRSNERSCSSAGEFTVRDVVLGAGNSVVSLALDFIHRCGSTTPRLSGSLRYESTVALAAMSTDKSALRFAAVTRGSTVVAPPSPQILRLNQAGPGTVTWTASSSHPWVTVSPAAGTGPATMTVGTALAGAAVPSTGNVVSTVTIAFTGASDAALTIDVTISFVPSGTTGLPFGNVDTPLDNSSGVTGAVPFTGWALDDIEVETVSICRAAVNGETPPRDPRCGGAPLIFVGNAVFIDGARPDVAATYPTHPNSHRGGWGFMVLTNMLPAQGNGTFVFSFFAHDREGHVRTLGTRTMTCANATADRPFGTIDTPAQGASVGGNSYINFGWALTQNPKFIPEDGSTITVFVDGVAQGSPSYNHYRPDIAAAFPGLANSNGAVGFKVIDTTALADGLHTINWSARDNAGQTAGLGSRYFWVLNSSSSVRAAAVPPLSSIAAIPIDDSAVPARRGWDLDAKWRSHAVGASGRAVIRGEELDRFELRLGPSEGGSAYTGYLRVGGGLAPLPAGCHLNSETGDFVWAPGVGFVGSYDFVFVRWVDGQPQIRRVVRIILQAKGSGHVGPQVVIDRPNSSGHAIDQPFRLAGWAADLAAAVGTGIDALHVWAYPRTGAAPRFLGVTTYGGVRPDVAAVHGDQFRESGFGLTVQGLPSGEYDLAVFAWGNISGGFAPATVVSISVR